MNLKDLSEFLSDEDCGKVYLSSLFISRGFVFKFFVSQKEFNAIHKKLKYELSEKSTDRMFFSYGEYSVEIELDKFNIREKNEKEFQDAKSEMSKIFDELEASSK